MEEKILQILKRGKGLSPDSDFKKRSYELILSLPQKPKTIFTFFKTEIRENLTFGLSLSLASVLLIIIFGGSFWNNPSQNNAAASREVVAEAERINFDIHLREARYFTESAEEVAAILDKINEPIE